MKSFLRILGFARPLGFKSLGYLLLVLGATLFGVLNLTSLIPLLQVLFDQGELRQVNFPEWSFSLSYFKDTFYHYLNQLISEEGNITALYYICGLMVISVLLANLFRYSSQILLAQVRVKVIQNFRNAAYQGILTAKIQYLTSQRKGDLISRVTNDLQEVEQTVVNALKVIIKDPLLIVGYFIVLISISVELTLYTLLLAPVTGFSVSLIARRIKKWSLKSQKSMGRISSIMDETISGNRIIKAFSAQAQMKKRFETEVEGYAKGVFQIAKKSNLASPISEIIGTAVLCLLLLIGGNMVLGANATLGAAQFIGFLIIFSQVLIPAKAIAVSVNQITRGLVASERVFEIIDDTILDDHDSGKIQKSTLEHGIRIEALSFSYDQNEVLRKVSFEIPKGKIIALVGASGSGKSTLVDLLCGFQKASSGQILVDGSELNTLRKESWRKLVGYVFQHPILFNDTIANNIAFGRENVSRETIEKAAKKANAHGFISSLLDGYDTFVGDAGDKLSGGEKQRITIARAILEDPPILILDEATSSLDAKSEMAVKQALLSVIKDRTALIISHKISTIKDADEIILMENGKIVGKGTHEKLIRESGLYQQLTELQTF